ncbi:MAG TPA: ABC transporter permease [Anaerolinea thermolimosa]|uniref:ABC transporter permease n=2 Tax=Anaerolinea thermolimosa TaxID=229919 RepID=A0A3D1JF13_9CHLR|nr:ABC-type multidrug transport system, permease component [Anaerolinea thermolimosa]HCE17181.1 ABC transporter permease [Anaerolinea thermolimosa]
MVNLRLVSLIRKEFIQIVRDPRTLALTFVFPLVMLFLLGYAATNDVKNISLAVLDQDRSAESRRFLDAFRTADYFHLDFFVSSEEEIRSLIDSNQARAGMIIPPGYADHLTGGRNAQVAFILDGSDPTVASTALAAANLIGQAYSTRVLAMRMNRVGQGSGLDMPLEVRTQVLYNPGMESAHYMIPGMIGMILQFLTTLLTATSIVRERERGTIEQLIVTPLRRWEMILGKLAPYVFIAFFDTLEVLSAGVLFFKVPINGSLGLLLGLAALFLVTTLGIGLLISTVAHTQQEAMLTTMFTVLPSIFLSGFFFPLAAMPRILQWISYLVPLRYFLIIVRGIVLKGVGLAAIWPEVLALSVFALVVMTGAAIRYRKRLD